ncbi:glycosyltransferase family 2 protein [Jeotgalibacillus soli]|uniref:glycosyltransferase family 2 protein n=1 Tax=Jeotgalibacillus soli TaxID=889306 RepID=UPI000596EC64|nr:glycosyltransferase family 2 protein [Jeotgalibacillus soli]
MSTISVVMPAFNAEEYITKAIKSILKQTVPVQEIIVVDDGSVDQTSHIVEGLKEQYPMIKLVKQENKGVSNARNLGMKIAAGDWILFLDADDECRSNLIETYRSKLATSSKDYDIAMVYTAFQQVDEQSTEISKPLRGKRLAGEEGFCDILMRNPIVSPSGVLVKKIALMETGSFNISLKYDEDVDLWIRLLEHFTIEYIDEPLSLIRRHLNNTTSSMSVSHNAEKLILDKYGIDYIKEKLFKRNFSFEKNSLDYALFLLRYEKLEECQRLLTSLNIKKESASYITFCFLRSVCFIHKQNFELAIEQYKIIFSLNKEHGASLNNAGILSMVNGDAFHAIQYFNQSLFCFPGYLDAKHNLQLAELGEVKVDPYRFTLRELRPVLLTYSKD